MLKCFKKIYFRFQLLVLVNNTITVCGLWILSNFFHGFQSFMKGKDFLKINFCNSQNP